MVRVEGRGEVQAKQRMDRGVHVEVVETVREIQGGHFRQNLGSGQPGEEALLTGRRTSMTEAIASRPGVASGHFPIANLGPKLTMPSLTFIY